MVTGGMVAGRAAGQAAGQATEQATGFPADEKGTINPTVTDYTSAKIANDGGT